MDLTKLTFNNRALFNFILIVGLLSGVLAFLKMSKLEDPEIKVKSALVITTYPGASAHETELEVTDVLEKAIRTMGNLDEINSRSTSNLSIIEVHLGETVPEKEVEQYWDLLRKKVTNARNDLPEDAYEPLILDDFGDVYGMFYAITSDGYSYLESEKYTDLVQQKLLEIGGVSRIQFYGKQKAVINIEISNEKLANLGISPTEIIMTLSNQGKTVYPGSVEAGSQRLNLLIDDKIETIDDIKNLVLQGSENDQLKLSDVAKVYQSYNEPFMQKLYYNNQQAVGMLISMEKGGNIVEIGEKVESKIREISVRLPLGIAFGKVFFQPDRVNHSIEQFVVNLIESILIVVIVLMFAMGFRSGLIIGAGLLFTILLSFPVLYLLDGTIQRVSLAAFIIAMGMLVDNSIVIVDGILVDLKRGLSRKEAMFNTARKTAFPLLIATFIAIFAFLPIFLSPDTTGVYTRDLFVVLAVSLLISWLLALSLVPLLSNKFLKTKATESKNVYDSKFYQLFKQFLLLSIKHKYVTISLTVMLLVGSFLLAGNMKQAFFTDFEYDQAYIEYELPGTYKIEELEKDLNEITEHLRGMDGIKNVTVSLGGSPGRYSLVRTLTNLKSNYGELIIDFTDYNTMKGMQPKLEKFLLNNYPQAYTRFRQYNISVMTTHLVEVQFSGPDPAVLRDLGAQAKEIMQKSDYIKKSSIRDNWEPLGNSLYAEFSQQNARKLGISRSDVSNALLASTNGLPIGEFKYGNKIMPILMKTRNSDGSKISDLSDIPVWNFVPKMGNPQEIITNITQGESISSQFINSVPLSQVSNKIDLRLQEQSIQRFNGERTFKVQADPIKGYGASKARNNILEQIEQIELPEAYTKQWRGEYYQQEKSMQYIKMYLPVAIILIIGMLVLLFKDFKKPVIIFLSIPLISIGIIPGLIISGHAFGFMAIIGAVGLMGMMIKNGVVLIDEIGFQLKSGKDALNAVIDSTLSRLSPVIMASLTTILGMIPLLSDAMFGSMAVTIMSGLLIGTAITLLFIPVLYVIFFRIDLKQIPTSDI